MGKSYWIHNPFRETRMVALSVVNQLLADIFSTYGKLDEAVFHEKLLELQHSFSDTSEMIYVKGEGAFIEESREIILTHSFWIGKHPVSEYEYARYCDSFGLHKPMLSERGKNYPMAWSLNSQEVAQYCNWLSDHQHLSPAYNESGEMIDSKSQITRDITVVEGYRFPTEVEWTYIESRGLRMNESRECLYDPCCTTESKVHHYPGWTKQCDIIILNARYYTLPMTNSLGVNTSPSYNIDCRFSTTRIDYLRIARTVIP